MRKGCHAQLRESRRREPRCCENRCRGNQYRDRTAKTSAAKASGSTRPLPGRPSLRYLKLEAKRRLAAGEFPALHDAQLAIAWEYGQPSWTALKQRISELPAAECQVLPQLGWLISPVPRRRTSRAGPPPGRTRCSSISRRTCWPRARARADRGDRQRGPGAARGTHGRDPDPADGPGADRRPGGLRRRRGRPAAPADRAAGRPARPPDHRSADGGARAGPDDRRRPGRAWRRSPTRASRSWACPA